MNVFFLYKYIYLRIDTPKYFDEHNNTDYWKLDTNLKPLSILL